MTAQSPTGSVSEYYKLLGPLVQMAWDDNFHFGYWDGPEDTTPVPEATDRFTDLLIERLRVGPGKRVLDAGCGIGKPALRVATSTGADVVGITVSELQVEQANERARAEGMADQVTFKFTDAMDTPFESESFDAVLAFESIHHMDREVALREMVRLLKPGGRIVLTDVTPPAEEIKKHEDESKLVTSLFGFDDWPGLVNKVGLELDELTDVTENTKGTIDRMIDGVLRTRREFEQKYGISAQEVLNGVKEAQPIVPGVGCLILVAHKP